MLLVDYAESRSKYMALRLKSTMTIVGTNENGLTRLVVSRADINLETIKEEYQRTFGISLLDEVQVGHENSFSASKEPFFTSIPGACRMKRPALTKMPL